MLDSFEILSTSGVVLWSKQYVPIGANVVNSLIRDIFIEERTGTAADDSSQKPTYSKEGYTLKWTTAKDLGLIFVAVYQSLIHLSWVDKLLDNVRTLFSELYRDDLKKRNTTSFRCNFDPYFDRQIQELEKVDPTAAQSSTSTSVAELTPPSTSSGAEEPPPPIPALRISDTRPDLERALSTESTPIATPDTSRPASPAVSHLLTAKQRPASRRARKAANAVVSNSAPASSGDESSASVRKDKVKTKKQRKWDASGIADEEDDTVLDYSQAAPGAEGGAATSTALEGVAQSSMGTRTGKGEFVLKDLDDEIDAIMAASNAKKAAASSDSTGSSGLVGSGLGAITGLFRNVVGGKTLTKEDLVKPLKGMEDHLLNKNVAREAAVRLCESVEQDLVGKRTESFTSIACLPSLPFLR